MATTRNGIVYTLTDPRDGAIRYVGKTINTPLERLAQHLSSPTNPAMRVWLASLGGQGLLPRMDTIATVADGQLLAEEGRLIKQHVKDGHRLLNSPYYQANLADLWDQGKQRGKAPKGAPSQSAFDASLDATKHYLYGSTAAAHAAGRLPPYAAASRVLLLAPILAASALFLAVGQTRIGRRVLGVFGFGWYAWQIGFDHAVRSLVLPHLPVIEALSFWREYLERPAQLLLVQAAGAALLAAWIAYVDALRAAKAERPKIAPFVRRPVAGNVAPPPSGI